MLFDGRRLDHNAQGVALMTELTFRIDERFEEKYLDGLAGEIRSAVLYVLGLSQGGERFIFSVNIQLCYGSVLCWNMRVGLPYMDLQQTTRNFPDSFRERIGETIARTLQELKETLVRQHRLPQRK